MNGAGRAIQAAVWSTGGHGGPGGRAMPELYERHSHGSRTGSTMDAGQSETSWGRIDGLPVGLPGNVARPRDSPNQR